LEENVRKKWFIRFAVLIIFVGIVSSVFPARAQQFGPWSAPVNLNAIKLSDGTLCPAVVNSAFDDSHPAISKDDLSLFFASTRPGGFGEFDLWVTQRDTPDDCWQPPVNLGPVVNSASRDFAPSLTTDGHWLYFHSNRPGGCGGQDMWVTHRQDKRDDLGWEAPINLGCTINTPGFDQAGPNYFEDDTSGIRYLYFTRRPIGGTEDSFDIFVSTCNSDLATCNTQGLWGPGTPVDALNSPFRDTRTAIRRRDGLEMILSTGRPGSLASENLWVSTRATTQDQNWLPPVPINCNWLVPVPCPDWAPLGPLVNSSAFDGAPALSWDGTELYFFSTRTDLPAFAGGRDLYLSRRTKLPD
jgi:hypothetical protein